TADTILVYSRGPTWTFVAPRRPLTDEQARAYRYSEPDGRRVKAVQLGDYTERSIAKLAENGRIHVTKTGRRYKKYYLDEASAPIDSLWTD
ncbi:hypothetical protein ABTM38_19565, partial [Acinetobacter baumannii]